MFWKCQELPRRSKPNFILSRGEICDANFKPLCEWCKSRQLLTKKNFSPFYFASHEIIEVKFCYRQTDKFFDTIYRVCGFFLQLNLLPPYALRTQGIITAFPFALLVGVAELVVKGGGFFGGRGTLARCFTEVMFGAFLRTFLAQLSIF